MAEKLESGSGSGSGSGSAPHSPDPPMNYDPGWDGLMDDFEKGGLTAGQFASFALAGVFIILLIITTILAIHASRRANVIDAESAQAAIGKWKESESEIVKSVPEPPRLHKFRSQSHFGSRSQSQNQSQSHSRSQGVHGAVPPLPLPLPIPQSSNAGVRMGVGVLGHMRRYSEEGRRVAEARRDEEERARDRARGRSRSRSRSMDKLKR